MLFCYSVIVIIILLFLRLVDRGAHWTNWSTFWFLVFICLLLIYYWTYLFLWKKLISTTVLAQVSNEAVYSVIILAESVSDFKLVFSLSYLHGKHEWHQCSWFESPFLVHYLRKKNALKWWLHRFMLIKTLNDNLLKHRAFKE